MWLEKSGNILLSLLLAKQKAIWPNKKQHDLWLTYSCPSHLHPWLLASFSQGWLWMCVLLGAASSTVAVQANPWQAGSSTSIAGEGSCLGCVGDGFHFLSPFFPCLSQFFFSGLQVSSQGWSPIRPVKGDLFPGSYVNASLLHVVFDDIFVTTR